MATFDDRDIPDLTGNWVLNRKLSTDPDEVFILQGVPWVVRKVLRHARLLIQIWQTPSISTSQSKSSQGNPAELSALVERADSVITLRVKQTVNPGGFDSEGCYAVDGSSQDLSLPIFGDISTQITIIKKSDIMEDNIRSTLAVASLTENVIQELARNKSKGWEAEVIWGFEKLDGKRYLTRNISTTKEEKKVIAKMVYESVN